MFGATMAVKCIGVVLLLIFVSRTFANSILRDDFVGEISSLEKMVKELSSILNDEEVKEEAVAPVVQDEHVELPSSVKYDEQEITTPAKHEIKEYVVSPVNDEKEELYIAPNEKRRKRSEGPGILEINGAAHTVDTVKKGEVLQGGDEILSDEQVANEKWDNNNRNVPYNKLRIVNKHWPKSQDGKVHIPMVLSGVSKQIIQSAINFYRKHSCIDFKIYETYAGHHIRVVGGGGCSSHIGMTRNTADCNGCQKLHLGRGCLDKLGIVEHEMMHALGFFHEQSRPDRDKYLVIYKKNIKKGQQGNFYKQQAWAMDTNGEPYDFNSVMQYGSHAFAIRRWFFLTRTMEKKNGDFIWPQREKLSAHDLKQLNDMYRCNGVTVV